MNRSMNIKGFLVIIGTILIVFFTLHILMQNDLHRKAERETELRNALAKLEEEVGQPLFRRSRSASLELTEAGEVYLETAKQILEEENFDYSIPLHLYSNYSGQVHVDFLDLCVQNAAEAGVTVEYVVDSNWTEHLAYTNYDLRYAGGMSNILTDLLAKNGRNFATTAPAPNGSNFVCTDEELTQYVIERYDVVIDNYKAALTAEEQQEWLDLLQANAYEDMYDIVLYTVNNCVVTNTAVVQGMPVFARDYEEIVDYKFDEWKLVG